MNDHVINNPTQFIDRTELQNVRTARVMAFFMDYLIIFLLCFPAGILVAFLGVLSFGAAWGLYAILPGLVAVLYLATTLGGAKQATWGMQMTGVHIKKLDGSRVDPFLAVLHGILFWVIHFTVLLLAISLFSSKKRLAHDILLGTYVVRD